MKKSVVSALTAAVLLGGVSVPAFAASNPFSDVNEHHWAYKAIVSLADAGIITGYDNSDASLNGKFVGGRNITRYEMAQMIAKTLARIEGESNVSLRDLLEGHRYTYVDNSGVTRTVLGTVKPIQWRGDNGPINVVGGSGGGFIKSYQGEDWLFGTNNNPVIPIRYLEQLRELAEEFGDELTNLGVAVKDLRDHSDKLQWHGKIEYTYGNLKHKDSNYYNDDDDRVTSNGYVFRLEPVAYVDDNCWVATNNFDSPTDDGYRHGHWSVRARLDSSGDMREDSTNNTKLKRAWVQGEWDKFSVKAGRFEFCPPVEDGIAIDTVISGGELKFGSKWQATITAGRIGSHNDDDEATYLTTAANDGRAYGSSLILPEYGNAKTSAVRIGLQYNDPGDHGFFGGAGYTHAKNNDFANYFYSDDADTTKASIWSVNLGYRFSDMMVVHGAFAQNAKADNEKTAWDVLLRYGNYADASEKGQWAVWGGYSKFGNNVGIASDQGDDIRTGTKGWHVGVAWAPFKNVGLLARYGDGKYITGGDKYKKIFGRVEMFF